jgi:competence protein ComK
VYEIDLSTVMLIGIDESKTKVVTLDDEFILDIDSKKIMDNSCKFFGSSLSDRVNMTKRLINISSKSPIIVEDSRNIIFFPLKSVRDKRNIWISFNNLEKYVKNGDRTAFVFKNNKRVVIDFSYYIIDNQVTRSLMLDYELKKRRESLEK